MITHIEATQLERMAEHNNGRCSTCHQTIKIYRYKLNQSHARFIRAMADAVRNQGGINDVDISTIGLGYSVRTQVTKMRLHGLIARIKNEDGTQTPRHWLITTKGFDFLAGNAVPKTVIVYDNQVLGHDDERTTIHEIMEEPAALQTTHEGEAVSESESRAYTDVRHRPETSMDVQAEYIGRPRGDLQPETVYSLNIRRLALGQPVEVLDPIQATYKDIAAFRREWRVI